MKISDIFNEIKKGITTVGAFFGLVGKLGSALQQAWKECGPQTITVASQVFYDVLKTAATAEQAAQAGTGGSWMGTVTLSEHTIDAVKQLVADAKVAGSQVATDLKTLEHDFTNPS